MDISIKLHTMLPGEKGCLSKEEIRKTLSIIQEELAREEGGIIYFSPYYSIEVDKFVDRVATAYAGKIPREYDYEFNRILAGLMGSTCYMADNFEKLNAKPIENILRIANQVEDSGHHSTFGHSWLTLEISGLPKALAMVLNNEHDYNTSEKSARYTVMKEIEPKQNELYNKWIDIFEKEIKKRYPNGSNKFFDPDGKKARKLAQENARYMISVFTPTNMEYTVSFRQLNYMCHWFEREIESPSNSFYEKLIPSMKEFVEFCKQFNLYSEKLVDGKDRELSLFDDPMLKTSYSSTFQGMYKMSFACLAQSQRHRTLDFSIDKLSFVNDFSKVNEFYIPPMIADNEELKAEYLKDIASVAEFLPQGTLLTVNESGKYKDFILELDERLCACAQKEIRDLTLGQTKEYRDALYIEAETLQSPQKEIAIKMANHLNEKSKGSRCMSGYECKAPCGFPDGVKLESEL